jgi:hypothetical protein
MILNGVNIKQVKFLFFFKILKTADFGADFSVSRHAGGRPGAGFAVAGGGDGVGL